ncbi:MAG: selenium metabolism-associated LysR family transcriptional regulator [Clostridiales bacterium]|nr:selenium metabolism-associated LysR family transcriptional regulator [Clostridiales bacterium]
MEFRQLEAFVAVSELKSFSKAAQQLYLTQPTISSHIKALEKELGTTLIKRTTKSFVLTEQGQQFFPYARRMLELKRTALEKLQTQHRQFLHLAASSIPSSYLLPQILASYREENPETYFHIFQTDSFGVENQVIDGTVDLGLTGQYCDNSRVLCEAFCSDHLVLAMPSTDYYYQLKHENPSLQRLLQEPMIVREMGSGTQKAANQFLKEHHIDELSLNIIARINDLESIKQMVTQGMGVSILSDFATRDLAASGQILTYPLDSQHLRKFYVLRLKERPLTRPLQTFIKYLKSYDFSQKPLCEEQLHHK